MSAGKPILSVVIPTLGRPILINTAESLIKTDEFSSIEVIIAGRIQDGATRRHIEHLVRNHSNIRHLDIQFETGDSSRKKNAGAAEAQADIIAFLDDDVKVSPDWPEQMIRLFEDPRVGLASGPGLVPDDVSLSSRLAGLALASRATGYVSYRYSQQHADIREISWSRVIGCNMAYRQEAFDRMGGFDPDFWPGEEMMASCRTQRLGYRLVFNPMATVYHYPRHTLGRFWRQMWGYGATRTRLIRMGAPFEASSIVPAVWAALTGVTAVGALFHRLFLWLFLADMLCYALVCAGITAEMFVRSKRVSDLLLFFVIPFMHVSYGLAEWAELFTPGRDLSEKPSGEEGVAA